MVSSENLTGSYNFMWPFAWFKTQGINQKASEIVA